MFSIELVGELSVLGMESPAYWISAPALSLGPVELKCWQETVTDLGKTVLGVRCGKTEWMEQVDRQPF